VHALLAELLEPGALHSLGDLLIRFERIRGLQFKVRLAGFLAVSVEPLVAGSRQGGGFCSEVDATGFEVPDSVGDSVGDGGRCRLQVIRWGREALEALEER
jgi:hypothetical protein